MIKKYPGRALFGTRFSAEDQVLSHLIFRNALPVRVFTTTDARRHEILIRSVDFFGGNIEVLFQQAILAAAEWEARHPERKFDIEQNPATAPLARVLKGHHILISSRRKDQLSPAEAAAGPLSWDENNQRAIYYPLFDWSEDRANNYIRQFEIPHLPAPASPVAASEPAEAAAPAHNTTLQSYFQQRKKAVLNKVNQVADEWSLRPKQPLFGLLE